MAHCVYDLCEVNGDSGAVEVPVVAGVVYQLRDLAEPQLQAGACYRAWTWNLCLKTSSHELSLNW